MSFSPTDLVGAALASCAVTTMALAATREGIPFGEATAAVEKRMTPPPRRIGELVLEITCPRACPRRSGPGSRRWPDGCPVARSLHPDVKLPVTFAYPRRAQGGLTLGVAGPGAGYPEGQPARTVNVLTAWVWPPSHGGACAWR